MVETATKANIPSSWPKRGRERVLILVKALPHVGQRHGETVCCAGVTMEGHWRRQYPIHFRRLKDQFSRWQWIEYDWVAPGADDRRKESRRVQEDTIQIGDLMPTRERAPFLEPILTGSTKEAASKGMSLTLIRPAKVRFRYKPKTAEEIAEERQAYEDAARQNPSSTQIQTLSPSVRVLMLSTSTGPTLTGRRTGRRAMTGRLRRPSTDGSRRWVSTRRSRAW